MVRRGEVMILKELVFGLLHEGQIHGGGEEDEEEECEKRREEKDSFLPICCAITLSLHVRREE